MRRKGLGDSVLDPQLHNIRIRHGCGMHDCDVTPRTRKIKLTVYYCVHQTSMYHCVEGGKNNDTFSVKSNDNYAAFSAQEIVKSNDSYFSAQEAVEQTFTTPHG